MVPVVCQATVDGKKVTELVDKEYIMEMMKVVRGRGAKVIAARGKSSAASAAEAALNHIHDWF